MTQPSASELLKALDETMIKGSTPWLVIGHEISVPEVDIVRWAYADLPPGSWDDADERASDVLVPIVTLRNALPALVELVEAAERTMPPIRPLAESDDEPWYLTGPNVPVLADALAHLREALSE